MKAGATRQAAAARASRPLWTCPRCGNAFVTRNLWHSCVRVPLAAHFEGRPRARAVFRRLLAELRRFGPVTVVSSRSRIALMVRVRFVACMVRNDWLRCHLWLKRRATSPLFVRADHYGALGSIYGFELREPADLVPELLSLLAESYRVGCQDPSASRRPTPSGAGRTRPRTAFRAAQTRAQVRGGKGR